MHTSFQSLAWLRQHLGPNCADVRVQGDEPLLLDDPSCGYATLSDHHQLFCVGYDQGRAVGRREHVATVQPGQLVFGLQPLSGTALILSGASGSVVWRFPTALLFRPMSESESRAIVAQFLDGWLGLLLDTLPRSPTPARHAALVADESTGAGEAGAFAVAARHDLVWIAPERPLLGYAGIDLSRKQPRADAWPLTPSTWALCQGWQVTAQSTSALLEVNRSAAFAEPFCHFVVSVVAERRASLSAARLTLDRASRTAETNLVRAALGQLASVGSGRRLDAEITAGEPLAQACTVIARHLGVPPPELARPTGDGLAQLQSALSGATGIRNRPVLLERDWHVHQSGPLLGYLESREWLRPVALLPTPRGYQLHDPATGTVQAIDESMASALLPQAHQFYLPLPAGAARLLDVLRVAATGAARDIAFIVGIGMATGALAMLVPWLTALVFDRIIPSAEERLLRDLGVVVLAVYLSLGLFDLARGFVLARVQARMDSTLEAAVWDRLLSLPLAFFRRFSAGDLSARAAGFGRIRDVLVGSVASALLGGLFSLWNLALLLYIDSRLACAGLGWIAALAATLVVSAYRSLDRERIPSNPVSGRSYERTRQRRAGDGKQ